MEIIDFFEGGLSQIRKNRLVFVTNILAWLFILGIAVALLTSIMPLQHSLLFSSFHVVVLVITYYVNISLVSLYIEKKKYITYVALFFAIFTIVSLARISFNLRYFENAYLLKNPIRENWTYVFSIFTTLMILALSFFYGVLINRSRKEKEYQQVISKQQEAQLQFLKAQMSPHFLFNSLNNIYSLTIGKAPKAAEMLLLLSDLLRYAVYESKKSRIRVESEIEQIKKLIQLYQMKSESPLSVSFESDFLSKDLFIEPMILIPLVENCFKHCNFDSFAGAYVYIRLRAHGNQFEFETENTKDESNSKDSVGGVGLENIQQRLSIVYHEKHNFYIENKPTLFKLKLTIELPHE